MKKHIESYLFIFFLVLFYSQSMFAQKITPDLYNGLKYRTIGPVGNRVISVVGVPGRANIFYYGAASGGVFKTTDGGVHWKPVADKLDVSSIGALAIARCDPNVVWAGTGETFIRSNISIGNGIYKSTDAGVTWKRMGLEKTGRIGRVVIDPKNPDIVFAAALGHCYGPQQERGVYRTKDGGKTWENVTKNIPDLPEWGTISNIEPSKFDAGTCYISVDFHQMNNRKPYIFKTENYGKKWKLISKYIPQSMLSYVHCVKEDPKRKGMLYAGTENKIYFSLNDGREWLPLQNNLPPAPVHWLEIQDHFSDLVLGTYGRGFWILDDITPLRELKKELIKSEVHLFKPRAAYRFQEIHSTMSTRTDADGQNPPYGASINYFLKDEIKDSVKITIIDTKGDSIRGLKATKKKGINRVWWDLRHDRAIKPKLRNEPLGHPGEGHGPERLRYGTKGWRDLVTWGFGGFIGPRVVPGNYRIKLTVGQKEFTQELEVRKDPNTTGTIEDIKKQVELSLKIRDSISEIAKMVNNLEWIRKQIDDLIAMLQENKKLETYIKDVEALDKKCISVEKQFFQLTLTGTHADDLRGPTMLYSKLMNLNMGVQTGDFAPNSQQLAVFEMLSRQINEYRRRYNQFINEDVENFNETMKKIGILQIFVPEK